MFRRHATRFKENPPATLFEYFFVPDPATIPCECKEFCVYEGERLIATSYIDVGERSISGVYGMFEPSESGRRLGIYTMLKEMEFAIDAGKEFYYLGYCYDGPSFYDYKKQFAGTEVFDWNGVWEPLPRGSVG
jgi:arginine-tRNA-protein transferase